MLLMSPGQQVYELRAWVPDVQSGGTARGFGNSSEQKEKAVHGAWPADWMGPERRGKGRAREEDRASMSKGNQEGTKRGRQTREGTQTARS